jgi:signal transduction histidine kinase
MSGEKIQKAPKYFDFLNDYLITKIFKDSSGLLWFVCQNKGVFVFDFKTRKHKLKERENCLDLIQTKPSEFAMAGKGFIETFNFKNNEFTNSKKFKNDYTIRSIKSHKSDLYFTTLYHGIKKLNPSSGKSAKIGKDLGLEDLTCYSLNIINSTLYIGTNDGLVLYDMKKRKSDRITKNEGLSDREFNSYSDFFDESTGHLYMGTQNGVTRLNTDNSFIAKTQFDLFLRKITYVNSSGEKKEIFQPKLDNTIVFPPQSYQIVIEMASNDLRSPKKTDYIYAFDTETPIKSENSNSLMFPYLPEDYYSLSVRAENERKQKSRNTLKIKFRIKPVFYKSGWFISLIILILSFSISLILYYQNQVKIKLVEAKTQFASDLHDEMGGDLTAIKFKTELLALKASDDQKRELLSIKNITESTMVNVSDLIWTLKPSNQTLGAMVKRIDKLLKLRLSTGKYKYKIKTRSLNRSAVLKPKVKENLYLILKETLSNFIKYSSYDTFNVIIANSGKGLIVKIFQDGSSIGNKEDTVGYGAFGISIMKERAKNAGFSLKIDKTKNWTTTIIIDKI